MTSQLPTSRRHGVRSVSPGSSPGSYARNRQPRHADRAAQSTERVDATIPVAPPTAPPLGECSTDHEDVPERRMAQRSGAIVVEVGRLTAPFSHVTGR